VLSWSLLEAMSVGCAIVASDTEPLREAIRHGDTGRLVDFFDGAALVDEVCGLLDDPDQRRRLGAQARAFACETYDLQRVCLPRQLAWIDQMAAGGPTAQAAASDPLATAASAGAR
jgi:glycosyltransferase involved in cell wall biosynthesis